MIRTEVPAFQKADDQEMRLKANKFAPRVACL